MSPRTPPSELIVLGIDPGLGRTGYGVVRLADGSLSLKTCGTIETPARQPVGQRLATLHRNLHDLMTKHRPDRMAVEQLFFSTNVKTAMVVSQARGVVMLAAAEHRLPIQEFSPLTVKQSVTGYGQANKRQVQRMLQLLFKLDRPPHPDDAADAVAVAVCGTRPGRYD
ncbi:MAG: crossover junction endodeoxyribonuclease RuvC [Candidatus Kerfeldbacteria bacterium]|nr:crossover junction endodeoxyribonuclease RuvC [Candidatus Kerfeldbacteria bacterium]